MIPTPYPELNEILGGGLPDRGLVEIFGIEGSGKTSLCINTAINYDHGGLFFDLDGTLLPWVSPTQIGIVPYHHLLQQDLLRDALTNMLLLIGPLVLVILDPIAVLGSKDIRLILPSLIALSARTCVVLVNHSYIMEESVGSSGLSYYCCQRLRFDSVHPIKIEPTPYGWFPGPAGIRSKISVVKNTFAPFPQSAHINIVFEPSEEHISRRPS